MAGLISTALLSARPARPATWVMSCPVPAGAEVGSEQALVSVENTDQSDIGQIVPLGEHLRAEQNLPFAGAHVFHQCIERAAPPGAVAVDAQYFRVGKALTQRFLQAFGALSERAQIAAAAFRAGGWYGHLRFAVMAAQQLAGAMHDHAGIAARTGGDPAAVLAQRRRVTTPVEEQQYLVAARQVGGDGVARVPERPCRARSARDDETDGGLAALPARRVSVRWR